MPISDADLLAVTGLDVGYGKVGVLHGVTMTVRQGEIVALLGPNGAGKTTLLKALSGLLPWTAGDATWTATACAAPTPVPAPGAAWSMW